MVLFSVQEEMSVKIKILIFLLMLTDVQGGSLRRNDVMSFQRIEEPWNCYDDEDCLENGTPYNGRTEESWNCYDDEDCPERKTPYPTKYAFASDNQEEIAGTFNRLKEELNNYFDAKSDDSDAAAESPYLNEHDTVVDNFEFDNNCDYHLENCLRDIAENLDDGDDDNGDKHFSKTKNQSSFERNIVEVIKDEKPDYIYFK